MLVLQFYFSWIFQCSMLNVLTLLILRKNPVIAEFTEAKRNRQEAKNKCCILLLTGIYSLENRPEAFLRYFVLCEWGVISVLINIISGTKM